MSAAHKLSALGQIVETSVGSSPPTDSDDVFVLPMSPSQQRLWSVDRSNPGNPAYNGAFRVEIAGPLDPDVLERTLQRIVDRHEVLRARCAEIDGAACLAVPEQLRAELAITDLRHLPAAAADAEMEARSAIIAKRRFALAAGPLFAFELIRTEPTRSVLALTFHQMVVDGYSVSLILDELPRIYEGLLAGRQPNLPEPKLQFGDVGAWLQDQLAMPAMRKLAEQKAAEFAGYNRLDIRPDLAPGGDPLDSRIAARMLPAELTAKLATYCAEQGTTMFSLALGACMITLAAATGRNDISVGTPLAGRNRAELEKVVGPLMNHTVLRQDLGTNPTLRDLDAQIRDAVLDAATRQDLPLETIVEQVAASGGTLPDPLFSVCFVCQRGFAGASAMTYEFAGCRMRTLPSKTQGALYDLFFFMVERETGWRLAIDYASSKFSASLIDSLLDGMIETLAAFPETPDAAVSAISARQSQPIGQLLGHAASNAPQAAADDEAVAMPASFTQERFWLLSKTMAGDASFNMSACLRIKGALDVCQLERSLNTLVERHETLRTSFAEIDGRLCQIIKPARELPLGRIDVSATDSSIRDSRLGELLQVETRKPFDLGNDSLVRTSLIRLADAEHVLVLTLHHIVSDGQSMGNLQRELWEVYAAAVDGKSETPSPLPIQFGDFAASQRDWIEQPAAQAQIEFWKRKLQAPLPILDFPLDRLPNFTAASGVAIEKRQLATDLVGGLRRMTSASNATMFAVTGAAFAALLARYSKAEDILFGCPVANRTPETAALVGPFAGPLALRVRLSGDPSLVDIVSRLKDEALDAFENNHVPFERIVDVVDARSVNGRKPLFQFYFLYQAAFLKEQQVAGLTIEPLPTLPVGTPYELQLALIERPTGVTAQLEYNPDLLDAATVGTVLDYYVMILQRMAALPSTRLSELESPRISTAAVAIASSPARARLPRTPPRDEMEERLAAIWRNLLKSPDIGVHDDFFQLGGQSMLAARMVVEVEHEFGVRISVSTVAAARTIADMARLIAKPDGRQAPQLVPMRPEGKGVPLFLVHCGGGHVLRYEDLVSSLPADQRVYGLAAPPLNGTETDVSVETLARRYIDEIRSVQPQGPYQIAGYSFGGLVAYEMATQLADAGQKAALVVILDTLNRAHYRSLSTKQRAQIQATYVTDRLARYRKTLAAGDLNAFAAKATHAVKRRLRSSGWRIAHKVMSIADKELPAGLQDNLQIFDMLADRYVPRAYPGRVVVVHAEERGAEYRSNPTLGWEQVAVDGVEVLYVPGDHMTFMKKPHVECLAGLLTGRLQEETELSG